MADEVKDYQPMEEVLPPPSSSPPPITTTGTTAAFTTYFQSSGSGGGRGSGSPKRNIIVDEVDVGGEKGEDNSLSALPIFIDEIRNEDGQVRINAMKRLSVIIAALRSSSSSSSSSSDSLYLLPSLSHLFSFLRKLVEEEDENVLEILAEEISSPSLLEIMFFPPSSMIEDDNNDNDNKRGGGEGGYNNNNNGGNEEENEGESSRMQILHSLYDILESLCSSFTAKIRDKAVESMMKIAIRVEFREREYEMIIYPVIKRLIERENWYPAHSSAALLISFIYPHLTSSSSEVEGGIGRGGGGGLGVGVGIGGVGIGGGEQQREGKVKIMMEWFKKLASENNTIVRRSVASSLSNLIDRIKDEIDRQNGSVNNNNGGGGGNNNINSSSNSNEGIMGMIISLYKQITTDECDLVRFYSVEISLSLLRYFSSLSSSSSSSLNQQSGELFSSLSSSSSSSLSSSLIYPIIKNQLHDASWRIRFAVADKFPLICGQIAKKEGGVINDMEMLNNFILLLKDNDVEVKCGAISRLGDMARIWAEEPIISLLFPVISSLLHDSSHFVRKTLAGEIIYLVGNINMINIERSIMEIILRLLKDDHPDVRLHLISSFYSPLSHFIPSHLISQFTIMMSTIATLNSPSPSSPSPSSSYNINNNGGGDDGGGEEGGGGGGGNKVGMENFKVIADLTVPCIDIPLSLPSSPFTSLSQISPLRSQSSSSQSPSSSSSSSSSTSLSSSHNNGGGGGDNNNNDNGRGGGEGRRRVKGITKEWMKYKMIKLLIIKCEDDDSEWRVRVALLRLLPLFCSLYDIFFNSPFGGGDDNRVITAGGGGGGNEEGNMSGEGNDDDHQRYEEEEEIWEKMNKVWSNGLSDIIFAVRSQAVFCAFLLFTFYFPSFIISSSPSSSSSSFFNIKSPPPPPSSSSSSSSLSSSAQAASDWLHSYLIPCLRHIIKHDNYLYRLSAIKVIGEISNYLVTSDQFYYHHHNTESDDCHSERSNNINSTSPHVYHRHHHELLLIELFEIHFVPMLISLSLDSVPNVRMNVAKTFERICKLRFMRNDYILNIITPQLRILYNDKDNDVKYFAYLSLLPLQ